MRVPHAEPHQVYDVRYHQRDTRRSLEPVLHGNKYTTTEVTAANVLDGLADAGPGFSFAPGKGVETTHTHNASSSSSSSSSSTPPRTPQSFAPPSLILDSF